MLTAVLSLSGALVYGAADFLGGLAARRLGAVLATAVAAIAGLVVLGAALPVLGGEWSPEAVAWGAVSGVTGALAISLLYASLAIGPMSILSPLTALVSAITPLAWGTLVGGERFGPLAAWALGLALVAVVLVGFVPERGAVRPSARGLAFATGSGLAIGAFYIMISQTPDESGIVPLVLNRVVNAGLMLAVFGVLVLLARRSSTAPALAAVHETTPENGCRRRRRLRRHRARPRARRARGDDRERDRRLDRAHDPDRRIRDSDRLRTPRRGRERAHPARHPRGRPRRGGRARGDVPGGHHPARGDRAEGADRARAVGRSRARSGVGGHARARVGGLETPLRGCRPAGYGVRGGRPR